LARAKKGLFAVAVLLVLYGYPLLLDIPLFDPDEGLHAAIAQEMLERGDWVTPRFLGHPFFDKPPLFFWAQALSMRLLGMNQVAVRLPGMLFAVLAVATTALLGSQLFGKRIGLLAGFFQATLILPLALAQAAVHDVALVPLLNVALFALWGVLTETDRRKAAGLALLAGAMLGLACLTKGLMGLVCVGIAVGGYLLFRRDPRVSRLALLFTAGLVAIAVCLPWYILMELRNPGYLHYYFFQRHVGGFVSSGQRHGNAPWWYYVPVLLGGGLPWISYLPAALIDWLGGPRETRPIEGHCPGLLLCVWLIGYTAFLCAAQSKLLTYLLPVFPAIAILAALLWIRLSQGQLVPRAQRMAFAAFRLSTAANPLILPLACVLLQQRFGVRYGAFTIALASVTGFSSWLLQRRLDMANVFGTMVRAAAVMAVVFVVGMTWIVPPVANRSSGRDLAAHFNRLNGLPVQLIITETRFGSLVFYLRPELRRSLREDQFVSRAVTAWMPTMADFPGTMLAIPEHRMAAANRRVGLEGLQGEQFGRYRLFKAREVTERMAIKDAATSRLR
jgi:4-amino-4-deoxy-L-arabinose transferase-like glycosyltransferase